LIDSVLKKDLILYDPHQAAERAPSPPCPEAAAQNPSWFEKAIETDLAGLRAALEGETREREKPRRPGTNFLNPSRVRPFTQRELKANTFPYKLNSTVQAEIKRSRAWIRYHLSGTKRGGQGFVIMDAHSDKNGNRSSALFDQMLKLCDNPWYSKEL